MSSISRRDFLKRSFVAGAAGTAILTVGKNSIAQAAVEDKSYGTVIDLTKCDGCTGLETPKCVAACRTKNAAKFPQPQHPIPTNWPTGKKEDWSGKEEMTDKLTPYNWSYVQKVEVDGEELNIPRRCMHCDNPPCANICPFSAQEKTPQGAVVINESLCFGGAKCRDVCPWDIPQRQAGVGLYMQVAPGFVGGGVMYKCDMCIDFIKEGKKPACVSACPNNAIQFGEKDEMRKFAHKRAEEINGYIYGEKENGGTSTFYVSPVPFNKIDKEIKKLKAKAPKAERIGIPNMQPEIENYLDSANGTLWGYAVAPVAGVFAAGVAAYKTMKGEE